VSARAGALAARIVADATAAKRMIATAESCTGGLIAAALTDTPGASACVCGGVVAYANLAKEELLGVDPELIRRFGAVSAPVAARMAEGALRACDADLAISVTGIAGPTGGTADKPVGLVWFGLSERGRTTRAERRVFRGGGRSFVRGKTVETALALLAYALGASPRP